jgi:hypothetical protein
LGVGGDSLAFGFRPRIKCVIPCVHIGNAHDQPRIS